jgi:hypothetical protein
MTKQYWTKSWNFPVEIVTHNGRGEHSLIYQFLYDGKWRAGESLPIDNPLCDIEEVPQEPLKIGDTWEKDGGIYTIAAFLQDGMVGVFYYWMDSGYISIGCGRYEVAEVCRQIQAYKERSK